MSTGGIIGRALANAGAAYAGVRADGLRQQQNLHASNIVENVRTARDANMARFRADLLSAEEDKRYKRERADEISDAKAAGAAEVAKENRANEEWQRREKWKQQNALPSWKESKVDGQVILFNEKNPMEQILLGEDPQTGDYGSIKTVDDSGQEVEIKFKTLQERNDFFYSYQGMTEAEADEQAEEAVALEEDGPLWFKKDIPGGREARKAILKEALMYPLRGAVIGEGSPSAGNKQGQAEPQEAPLPAHEGGLLSRTSPDGLDPSTLPPAKGQKTAADFFREGKPMPEKIVDRATTSASNIGKNLTNPEATEVGQGNILDDIRIGKEIVKDQMPGIKADVQRVYDFIAGDAVEAAGGLIGTSIAQAQIQIEQVMAKINETPAVKRSLSNLRKNMAKKGENLTEKEIVKQLLAQGK